MIIKGRVQGVYFRHHTNITANKLGLKGYVKNHPDGCVEVIAQGNDQQLKELLAFCRKGPTSADVEDVKVEYQEASKEFEGFSVRY